MAWPHGGLLEVPRLANDEPVRGTGCGGHTETTRVTPTTIPDGTWFGAIQSVDDTPSLAFDLICAYESEAQARRTPHTRPSPPTTRSCSTHGRVPRG